MDTSSFIPQRMVVEFWFCGFWTTRTICFHLYLFARNSNLYWSLLGFFFETPWLYFGQKRSSLLGSSWIGIQRFTPPNKLPGGWVEERYSRPIALLDIWDWFMQANSLLTLQVWNPVRMKVKWYLVERAWASNGRYHYLVYPGNWVKTPNYLTRGFKCTRLFQGLSEW